MSTVFPPERIERVILLLRGHKIILDRDLAAMYGVSTRDLNKAVSRNIERFPDDFMLQLTRSEFNDLKFQFGTSSWGGTRKLPRAFTEQGIAMLSGVLRSTRARAPIVHGVSWRNRGEALRDRRVEPRGKEAYSLVVR
jgi:hypothetical protein